MTVKIVFNELSLNKPFDSKQVAMEGMIKFIETLRTAIEKGAERELCTKDDFDFLPLSLGYQIVQWRNDRAVDREHRSFLRSLQNRNYTSLPDMTNASFEATYLENRAIGLEYTFSCEGLAVSFQSEEQWDCDSLKLSVMELQENGELHNKTVDIFHASSERHILNHTSWIVRQSRINIISGSDLWERRSKLFPNLEFCEETAKQLIPLQPGNTILRPVSKRLFELEDYCKNWHIGGFSPDDLACSITPESQATLNKYGGERTFMCPDGQKRIFSWHVRLTPMAWRVHLIPVAPNSLNSTGKMIIGYVGRHLSTTKFN